MKGLNMDIEDRLREARLALSKTQEQVAQEAGMKVTQYNGYERGRSRPAPATLDRIAAALQTTSAALRGEFEAARGGASAEANRSEVVRKMRAEFRARLAAELGLSQDEITVRIELL
jgi:transcriptional regulator with XRE-family HTH domain